MSKHSKFKNNDNMMKGIFNTIKRTIIVFRTENTLLNLSLSLNFHHFTGGNSFGETRLSIFNAFTNV